jgi:hypothetical protein
MDPLSVDPTTLQSPVKTADRHRFKPRLVLPSNALRICGLLLKLRSATHACLDLLSPTATPPLT